jgi:hypothetical protein
MSIEVLDGSFGASLWQAAHGDDLIEAGLEEGLLDWAWQPYTWGVILEVSFPSEAAWERFRAHPSVVDALGDVPDPITGLIVYRGWGGRAGTNEPRKPRPLSGSGAAALPLPSPELFGDVFGDFAKQIASRQLINR